LLIKSYLQERHQKLILNDKYASHNTYYGWGKIKHGGPLGIIPGTIFLIYLYNILKITNNKSKIVIFTDDASTIIINPKP
jgi:hypothetical protein